MRYSNNLNIMLKACEKAGNYILRDFVELENLQSNSKTAHKFTNSCYHRVKKIIIDDLMKFKPKYNFHFSDGEKIINDNDSEYHFTIFPINGITNLCRANSDFVIAIALSFGGNFQDSQPIAVAINKIIPNEIFYCEKDFGAFKNNRRIKVAARQKEENILVTNISDFKEFNAKNNSISTRNCGSKLLELAYLACNRLDFVSLKGISNYDLILPFTLIATEAGAKNLSKDNKIIACGNEFIF